MAVTERGEGRYLMATTEVRVLAQVDEVALEMIQSLVEKGVLDDLEVARQMLIRCVKIKVGGRDWERFR